MTTDTRRQLLDTAENLFAERGFYGVSIAAVAEELGLTKQALLHHFGSKEKLYGAVLKRISEDYEERLVHVTATETDPANKLKAYMLSLAIGVPEESARIHLLMRELLDNRRRAEDVGTWYLKPYLETLIRLTKEVPGWERASDARALALVYQLLGAINYYAVSQPTLSGIFRDQVHSALRTEFPVQLAKLIDVALETSSLVDD